MGDKVIQFPGAAGRQPPVPPKRPRGKTERGETEAKNVGPANADPAAPIDIANLDDEQKKAIQIVLSGMPFVAIGIKSTPSGADFFTAVHGEASDLRNASSHLAGVIERAFERKGI